MNLIVAKRAMGLLSIGLGVLAVAAPNRVSRWLGLEAEAESMSAFGAREIASGAGLMSPVKPGPWFWMRLGGDLMDLAALGKAINSDNPRRKIVIGVTAVVGLIAILDLAIAAHATTHPEATA